MLGICTQHIIYQEYINTYHVQKAALSHTQVSSISEIASYSGTYMPSYTYRRQLAPSQRRETLVEVKARLVEELKQRTEEGVNHWNRLEDWCRQSPGRFIRIDWRANRSGNNSNASSAEDTGIIDISAEDSIGSSSTIQEFTDTGRNNRHTDSDGVVVRKRIVEQPD